MVPDKNSLDSEFQNLASVFRPKFGSQKDIDIVNVVEEINKVETQLKAKLKAAKGATALEKKLFQLKRQAVYLLKNN